MKTKSSKWLFYNPFRFLSYLHAPSSLSPDFYSEIHSKADPRTNTPSYQNVDLPSELIECEIACLCHEDLKLPASYYL